MSSKGASEISKEGASEISIRISRSKILAFVLALFSVPTHAPTQVQGGVLGFEALSTFVLLSQLGFEVLKENGINS